MEEALKYLNGLLETEELNKDTKSIQAVKSAIMVLEAALARDESIGTYVVK